MQVAWVAQSAKHLTLDFGSGHDLTVREMEPRVGLCADSTEPAWESPSPSFSLPLPCSHARSTHVLSLNKHTHKRTLKK